jgi:DNA replication protein DnaC
MAYNKKDYARIKREYSEKYIKARLDADMRRQELYSIFPEIKAIDDILSKTGLEIMGIITSESAETAAEKVVELKKRNERLLAERAAYLRAHGYAEDHSDIRYECDKCGDTGYVDTKMCDCMRRALIMAGYESSGLGKLIRTQSFDNFSLENYSDPKEREWMEHNVKVLRRFAENFSAKDDFSFLLTGSTGLGKTHLSTAVAKTVIERGYDVAYVTAVKMMNDFEERRFHRGERDDLPDTTRYYDAQLLIIDDFGTEVLNQFTVSCMYDVINTRINNGLSTIINTNLPKNELEKKYGERIASRLFGEYTALLFKGTDMRYKKIR